MASFNARLTFDHIRNSASGWTSADPVLGYGVIGLETDTGKIKIGNGTASWSQLLYSGGGTGELVSSVQGKTGTVTLSVADLTAAPAVHTHSTSDIAGFAAALEPVTVSVATVSASQNDWNLGPGDIFYIYSSTSVNLNVTGLQTVSGSVARLIINASTQTGGDFTLKHNNTNSSSMTRLVVPWSGDFVLSAGGGAALVVRSDGDTNWRVV